MTPISVTRSIRWNLMLWLGFLLLIVFLAFSVTAYQLQRLSSLQSVDESLAKKVAIVSKQVREPGPFWAGAPRPPGSDGKKPDRRPPPPWDHGHDRAPPPEPPDSRSRLTGEEPPPPGESADRHLESIDNDPSFSGGETEGYYFIVWRTGAGKPERSKQAPTELPLPLKERQGDISLHTRTRAGFREAWQFTERGELVLCGRSIQSEETASHRLVYWYAGAGLVLISAGLGFGWSLAGRALKPIIRISETARRISKGNLSERINQEGTKSELDQLAAVLNETFARLEDAFAEQRRFTADAAHELRTPLAVIISETQTALSRERTPEEYRDSLKTCLDTAQRLRRLSENLLQLARFDAGKEALDAEELELIEVAEAAVEIVKRPAAEKGVSLTLETSSVRVRGDFDQLSRLLINLVDNAIRYSATGTTVTVSVGEVEGFATLTVSDQGCGIREEELGRIFERFFRADRARSSKGGHSGLGLAICRSIARAHGGEIQVSSKLGVGSEFKIVLPVSR